MRKYNELSDEQLQKLAASGDAGAEEELTDRYTSLVNLCAQPYYLPGGDRADLTQEGMVGLLSAIRKYRQEENVPFRAYAELCIRRRIFSAIRYSSRQKHEPLNTGVSLEESMLNPPRESRGLHQTRQRYDGSFPHK